jgi:hypothetical protein
MTREEAIKVLETERAWIKTLYEVSNLIVTAYKASFIEAFDMAIEALQERPKGRWSKNIQSIGARYITYYKCSACEKSVLFGELDYCPNCGADMRDNEEQDV